MSAVGPPLLEARALRKIYREGSRAVEVLRGVDLRIHRGEHLAILGRSGSGKTTLLNLCGALDRDYLGSLRVEGHELRQMSERALGALRNRTIGFVYQSFHLLPHLTALENVALPAFFAPADPGRPAEIHARAEACLERVGLQGLGERRPLHLSGGERQRVAIARALFARPPIILCDEPTGSLDEATGARIQELFADLVREAGLTLVVVTHDARVAAAADRRIWVRDGRVAAEPDPGPADPAPGPGAPPSGVDP